MATRRVVPGENFLVTKDNLLKDDETTRAREWGRIIARDASSLIAIGSHTQQPIATTDRYCLDHEKRTRQTAEVSRLRRRTRRYQRQPMMRGTVTMGGGYTVKLWSNPRRSTASPPMT